MTFSPIYDEPREACQPHGSTFIQISRVTCLFCNLSGENLIFFCYRKREESIEKISPQMQEMKISMLERENYTVSNKTGINDERDNVLEQNLRRFEEERRQFEKDKLKFLEEKRELDRLRLQRFERYKRELEAKRLGLNPNYDIDNPNDYLLARKVVIDYSANQNALDQDSGSESDEGGVVTVVENKEAQQVEETPKTVESEPKVVENNHVTENSTKKEEIPTKPELKSSKSSLDEKLSEENHQQVEKQKLELQIKQDELKADESGNFATTSLIKHLIQETYEIWKIHKLRHSPQWRQIKIEMRKCLSELLLFLIMCGLGGVIFQYIEGNNEVLKKATVKRVKRDFIDQLWLSSHNLR